MLQKTYLIRPERAQFIKVAIIAEQKVRDGLFKASANESSCGIRKPDGAITHTGKFSENDSGDFPETSKKSFAVL